MRTEVQSPPTDWLRGLSGCLSAFFLIALKRVTPDSALEVYNGRSAKEVTRMINDWSESAKDKCNLLAGAWEQDVSSDLMMILPVWICMPQVKMMMQMLQTENDREVVDDVKAGDSRKVKSSEAEVISQILKPRYCGLFNTS